MQPENIRRYITSLFFSLGKLRFSSARERSLLRGVEGCSSATEHAPASAAASVTSDDRSYAKSVRMKQRKLSLQIGDSPNDLCGPKERPCHRTRSRERKKNKAKSQPKRGESEISAAGASARMSERTPLPPGSERISEGGVKTVHF